MAIYVHMCKNQNAGLRSTVNKCARDITYTYSDAALDVFDLIRNVQLFTQHIGTSCNITHHRSEACPNMLYEKFVEYISFIVYVKKLSR